MRQKQSKILNPYRNMKSRQQRTGAQATKSLQCAASVREQISSEA